MAYSAVVVLCLVMAFFILQSLHVPLLFSDHYADENTGVAIDSLNGVEVYYNGDIDHVAGIRITGDGYEIGKEWQCVEFVKRYYYEYFHHKMPDPNGNAKDIFDHQLPDASYNEKRGLVQYADPSLKKPAVNDIIVFDGHLGNKYGHVAIISKVTDHTIEIVQQNAGPDAPSRETLTLIRENGRWHVQEKHILGWLRIE